MTLPATASARIRELRLTVMPFLRALATVLRRVPRGQEGPHAQFGEDRILADIFGGREHGYCVEVGAYDGITGSATYLFERKGWDCLLVEPIPELSDKIRRNRRCIVVNCAASRSEGEATLHVADRAEQMSTLDLTPGDGDLGFLGMPGAASGSDLRNAPAGQDTDLLLHSRSQRMARIVHSPPPQRGTSVLLRSSLLVYI